MSRFNPKRPEKAVFFTQDHAPEQDYIFYFMGTTVYFVIFVLTDFLYVLFHQLSVLSISLRKPWMSWLALLSGFNFLFYLCF